MIPIFWKTFLGGKLKGTNNFIDGTKEYKKCTNLLDQIISNLCYW